MTKHGAKAIHCRLGLANIVDFSNSFFFLVSPFVSRFLIAGALRLSSPLYLRSFATHSLPCLRACLHINHALLAVVRTEIITIIKRKRDILSEEAAKKKKKGNGFFSCSCENATTPFFNFRFFSMPVHNNGCETRSCTLKKKKESNVRSSREMTYSERGSHHTRYKKGNATEKKVRACYIAV